MPVDEISQGKDHLLPVERLEAAPGALFERSARGGHRDIDVCLGSFGNLGQSLPGRRIDGGERLATLGRDGPSVDDQAFGPAFEIR
ncbi:hypothetical protein D3C86_1554750 [compost metagenome]